MELELEPLNLPSDNGGRPIVIAGPCSAETEEQVMNTAKQLAAKAVICFVQEYGNHVQNQVVLKVMARLLCHG